MKRIKEDERSSEKRSSVSKNPASVKSHWGQYWQDLQQNKKGKSKRKITAVWAIRIVFVLVMILLCALLGYLAYTLLYEQEIRMARTQFESITTRAMIQAKDDLRSRVWAGITLSNMVSELYPNAEQWPYIEWQGFENAARNILETSHGEDVGFVPFVDPQNLTEFEDFAQNLYQMIGLPNNTAVKSWGFGVWARDRSVNPVEIYHDTTAETPYNSPYNVIAPILRTDEGFHPVLLFNVHSQAFTGNAIDSILTCSERRRNRYQAEIDAEKDSLGGRFPTMPPNQCGAFTDIFQNNKLGGRWTVGNFNPIYPRNDPLKVVGYIPAMTPLDNLLENMFPSQVTGINAVFETGTRTISFSIVNGHANLIGEGTHIDHDDHTLRTEIELAEPVEFFSTDDGLNVTKKLVLSLVSNEKFYEGYRTNGPLIAAVVVVCSILLTILVFLLYDFYVRREFNAKQHLLEARRQFMRFVSHEVRTPLNAVSMGLDLMQSEVANALGFDSPTTFRANYEMVDDEAFEASQRTMRSSDQSIDISMSSSNHNMRKIESSSSLEEMGDIKISAMMAKSWFQLSQEIQGNAQGAVDILNDLLNYDKIEQGKLILSLEKVAIWDLVEKTVMEFKVPASSKKVVLGVAFGEETRTAPRAQYLSPEIRKLSVAGDPVRLSQVVRNLMSNALKFTPSEGSIRVQAIYVPKGSESPEEHFELQEGHVFTGCHKGCLHVRVIDSGAGMSQDQVERLFQDGVQFNANELQAGGGSGLGLYIAMGIVMQHKGTLQAKSDGLGQGTTFEMILPLWDITSDGKDEEYDVELCLPADHDEGTTSPTSPSIKLPKSKLKVLVVDDVKSNRKLLRRILEMKGHECHEAEDGDDCVAMVEATEGEETPYDSILLDYEMPKMDGPTAAKEIRCTLLDDGVNIIGVTGNVLPEDINFFQKCGANAVLSKPVKIAELTRLWEEQGILAKPGETGTVGDIRIHKV
ncbi:unnamed protein product [Cylindrotheca closterium]|uniref:histidine kinase n=1 Tax=Cylindrotheca closterium TaxID=2856 RepID=A0AAD2FML4_9STRA|nr:unnamed protein product [Cylindrotheca closterium]